MSGGARGAARADGGRAYLRLPLARVGALAVAFAASAAGTARAQVGDVRDVPDPAVIKDGNAYYIYATGDGIPIRRSTDLVHWARVGRVFPGAAPAWAQRVIPGTQYPWAPDVSFMNGRYHLYYALSTLGGQHSAIALATNATLDPRDPRYRWEDRGVVLESHPGDAFNAIDPAAVVDEQGTPWLTWGSFWTGIKLRRLDPATGKLSGGDTTTYSVAARAGAGPTPGPPPTQAIEGPYLVRHGGYYYLFVSWDACCDGPKSTYNVRVGRSRAITGPYLDRDSVPMTRGGGTLVLASYGVVRGPGHNSVLTDGGRSYIVHHYVNANDGPATPGAPFTTPRRLEIRPLYWAWGGWPVAGEPLTPP